jgi:hypothetical protein
MAVHADREAFIPFRKADVVQMCLNDGKLSPADQKKFQDFCEILAAFYHFDFHKELEKLKDNFAPFNPDADTRPLKEPTAQELKEREEGLVEAFCHVLEKANYRKLTEEDKTKALAQQSLITLKMDINFDDFQQMVCYHRGAGETTVQVKKGFKKVDFTMETYGRVVLLLKFKDAAYFKAKKVNVDKLNFTPGKTYVYMYKNIPQADLEVIFPNVQVSMAMKDRLMLFGPAGVGAIPVMLKALPGILALGLAIAFFTPKLAEFIGLPPVDPTKKDEVLGALILGLTGIGILGGFVFKQYVAYKNKRIKFLKDLSDTLFFKALDFNGGVFNALVDAAEEEECKEAILAYYHLLITKGGLTQEQLDDQIEEWLEQQHNAKVDFNVEKALKKLSGMKGKLEEEDNAPEVALVSEKNGLYTVPKLDDAKTVIDYVWDNLFQYS